MLPLPLDNALGFEKGTRDQQHLRLPPTVKLKPQPLIFTFSILAALSTPPPPPHPFFVCVCSPVHALGYRGRRNDGPLLQILTGLWFKGLCVAPTWHLLEAYWVLNTGNQQSDVSGKCSCPPPLRPNSFIPLIHPSTYLPIHPPTCPSIHTPIYNDQKNINTDRDQVPTDFEWQSSRFLSSMPNRKENSLYPPPPPPLYIFNFEKLHSSSKPRQA